MHSHNKAKRLLEIADKETRLTESELDHLEKCSECLALYAKSILEVARTRAKDKLKKPSTIIGAK
jgi:DNA polymerase III delta prime subunit